MIIRRNTSNSKQDAEGQVCVPAWQAIESIQKASSEDYWVVTQPDHAHLSGAIAASFDRKMFPKLTPDVVEAIALHDEGWAQFEGSAAAMRKPSRGQDGKPLTFLDASPEMFLKAWTGSIEAASKTSAAGQYIVSAHFLALGERRLKAVVDPPETTRRILDFNSREGERQSELAGKTNLSDAELRQLLSVLQFCDLISLAICAGSTTQVEFPQDFGAGRVCMTAGDRAYRLVPSPVVSRSFKFPVFQCSSEPSVPQDVAFSLS